jgi:hypothetical protein
MLMNWFVCVLFFPHASFIIIFNIYVYLIILNCQLSKKFDPI